ncbi:hypothetical protein SLOPH_616 [Spraguea lophii 42_110]|uniref:Uncharacterized protein n=1 Tax=Spraguea lophii (strain 42_110) TaxID=1358809 RepID=S7XWA3_SPRLO|nr:hypothetical protein SLOPH_616 [Spraguea lophii 42_110]
MIYLRFFISIFILEQYFIEKIIATSHTADRLEKLENMLISNLLGYEIFLDKLTTISQPLQHPFITECLNKTVDLEMDCFNGIFEILDDLTITSATLLQHPDNKALKTINYVKRFVYDFGRLRLYLGDNELFSLRKNIVVFIEIIVSRGLRLNSMTDDLPDEEEFYRKKLYGIYKVISRLRLEEYALIKYNLAIARLPDSVWSSSIALIQNYVIALCLLENDLSELYNVDN